MNGETVCFAAKFVRDYNPEEGRGSKNPASKEQAMKELLDVVKLNVYLYACV